MNKKLLLFVGLVIGLIALLFGIIKPTSKVNENTIIISNKNLEMFYFNNLNPEKPFNPEYASLSEKQMEKLKKDFVEREVLKREAKILELDKIDSIISARLSQLGKQALVGEIIKDNDVKEKDISNFFEKNKHNYIEQATISFTHIFFRHEDNATSYLSKIKGAGDETLIEELVMNGGVVFPYQKNYSNKSKAFVLGHFGEDGTNSIFNLKKDLNKWIGPVKSSLGFHLVKVYNRKEERQMEFKEVFLAIKKDYLDILKKDESKRIIQNKISEYTVIDRIE